jgi:type I restriction enzyme S subunit
MSFVSRLFLKTKIRIPTLLPDQEKACAVLESAEAEIKAATLKLEKLNDQKRGLMQKLLTGEVRVAA